jgi:transcriptional regulator with XRE-family HTH domain
MPVEKNIDPSIYHQVKAVMKSLNIDQAQLGEKLDLTQASVSKALNGGNEKTFKRIMELLGNEYGVTSLNQHLESVVGNDIAAIKSDLQEIKEELKELRKMIGKLQK